jgi:CheY-like chemotaxis protein
MHSIQLDSQVATSAPSSSESSSTPGRTPDSIGTNYDHKLPPILVADDDPDDTFFVQRLINKTGVKNPVLTFDDGSKVVSFLERVRQAEAGTQLHQPILLFLDLKMNHLGGFGFLEWARMRKDLAPLTIVVLTSSSQAEDMARALALGAHRYLVKYPSIQTFTTIVRSVFPVSIS